MRHRPAPSLVGCRRRSVIGSLDGRRNSVVVLTALIALLTMHGLTTDHGMSMPSMSGTTGPALTSMTQGSTDPHHGMPSVLASTASQLQGSVIASSVAAAHQLDHAGGLCVAILGLLLLWFRVRVRVRVRTRRRQLLPGSFATTSDGRAIQARAGQLLPRLRPSLVTLGISRT